MIRLLADLTLTQQAQQIQEMEIDNFLPGSASLVEMVDKRLLISLRDGRQLFGFLRSYDQFGNLVKSTAAGYIECSPPSLSSITLLHLIIIFRVLSFSYSECLLIKCE